MKKIFLIFAAALVLVLLANADASYTVEKHRDKVCDSFFEYETVSFADKKYKVLENAINGYVEKMAQKDKRFLRENEADFPHLKNCNAVESWGSVNARGRYLTAHIIYWYYFGASPWYLTKSFTFDTNQNALVNLAQITGLSGEQIFDEVVRQLYENNVMTEFDKSRLDDCMDEREWHERELENQAFAFTDDGRIRLSFDKSDFFGKPDFEFYLDVKQ